MSAQDAAHVDCKTAGCSQVTEPLAGPRRVFGHVELGYMDMPVEQMALIERATTAMNLCLDVARTQVLDEHPLQLYAAFLEPARSRNGRNSHERNGDEQCRTEVGEPVDHIEHEANGQCAADHDGEEQRHAVDGTLGPQMAELVAVVLLHYYAAQERRDKGYYHHSAHRRRQPAYARGSHQAREQGQEKHKREDDDSHGEGGIDNGVGQHTGKQVFPEGLGRLAHLPVVRRVVVEAVEVSRPRLGDTAFEQLVGRLGKAYHVRCEEGGDYRHRHHNGIEKLAYHSEREAQRGYDERKLAYLGHREAAAHGLREGLSAEQIAQRAKHRLPDDDDKRYHHDGQSIVDKHLRVDEHTHRHEEHGSKEVLHRVDEARYLVGLDGFGKDAAHHERTESSTEAHLGRQNSHEAAQSERHDKQRFASDEAAHRTQKQGDGKDADHKPQHQEERYAHHAAQQLAAIDGIVAGNSREKHHHNDGKDVLENEHAHNHLGESLLPKAHVVEGFVDYRGARHGQHSAKKEAVHRGPAEEATRYDAQHNHGADYRGGCYGRADAHLHYFLEREIESEREQQKYHADVGPRLYVGTVDDGHGVGHMGRHEEACHDVAQHQRLAQTLEDDGYDACHDECQGKILNEWMQFGHLK